MIPWILTACRIWERVRVIQHLLAESSGERLGRAGLIGVVIVQFCLKLFPAEERGKLSHQGDCRLFRCDLDLDLLPSVAVHRICENLVHLQEQNRSRGVSGDRDCDQKKCNVTHGLTSQDTWFDTNITEVFIPLYPLG